MVALQARGRGRPRRASARGEIVGATLALLAERGLQATTMDAIAERAGVAKSTIYRRWAGKEDLIADAVDELATPHVDLAEDGGVHALLRERARDVVRAFGDPVLGRILPDVLGELQRNRAFAVAFTDRVIRPRRRVIVDALSLAVRRGELRRGVDVDVIADLLVGPSFLRQLVRYGRPVSARYADEVVETIWRGISPAREPLPSDAR